MARNNPGMLTDTSTACERVTGEIPRTVTDMATYQPYDMHKLTLKVPDTRFVDKLKDYIQDNMIWLHFVNSERVRRDVVVMWDTSWWLPIRSTPQHLTFE